MTPDQQRGVIVEMHRLREARAEAEDVRAYSRHLAESEPRGDDLDPARGCLVALAIAFVLWGVIAWVVFG